MQLLKKGSKEGKMITLLQPGEGVQLGSQYMTDRGKLLMISDSLLILAQFIPAIIVPVCVDANDTLLLPVHDRELSNVVCDSSNSVWICSQCNSSLKKHKLPSFASVNNMCVPPVPSELSCLNSMEKRLIRRIQPFMKLIVLPYGQCTLKGQTVNFPVNTSEVCSSLPRTLDNAGIVLIAPERTGSCDSTETPVTLLYVGRM